MARWCTIFAVFLSAGLFGWAVPLLRIFGAMQPMITALSIMVAAVFVRLNRGMPSLEWKSVEPNERQVLTTQIVSLAKEYASLIAINATVLLGLVALTAVGRDDVAAIWPQWVQRLTSGLIGALGTLCIARMAYVIWRDIDVVSLQKRLIDGVATDEMIAFETKSADDKIASIKASGLRRVEISAPKAWGE